jgi:hypothetical protein
MAGRSKERGSLMRECHECGEIYSRCNKVEIWVRQNPGHRFGWIKVKVAVCCKCMPQARVRQMLSATRVYFGPVNKLLPTPSQIKKSLKEGTLLINGH